MTAAGRPPALDEQLLMQFLEAFALSLQPGALGGDIRQRGPGGRKVAPAIA